MSDIIQDENIISDVNDDPVINDNGSCYDPITDQTIYDCISDDNKTYISGYTSEGIKARYIYKKHRWYYGKDICKSNLINLSERTYDERLEIVKNSHIKAQENREKKKNINELAKAMLEQTMTERQIKEVMGDNTNILTDNSVASAMIGAMIQAALNGSFKAFEAVRDTAGYKPESRASLELTADIMTDADRALLDRVNQRLTG